MVHEITDIITNEKFTEVSAGWSGNGYSMKIQLFLKLTVIVISYVRPNIDLLSNVPN